MANVLLILHVIGLMLGVTGSLGGAATLAYSRPAQKQKGGPLRGIGPAFARMASTGVVLMWPTGIALVVINKGAGATEPMFLMKMVFVLLLTLATFGIETIYGRARREPQVARLLPSLGPLAVLSYLMVAIFSVLAFG